CRTRFPMALMPSPEQVFAEIPERLRAQTRGWVEEYLQQVGEPLTEPVRQALPRVFAMSEFVARTCLQEPALLPALDTEGLLQALPAADVRQRLEAWLADVDDVDALGQTLRRFRRQEMIRI